MNEDMRSDKRTETVAARVSEQTALALLREATKEGIGISEFLDALICRELYGRAGPPRKEENVNVGERE